MLISGHAAVLSLLLIAQVGLAGETARDPLSADYTLGMRESAPSGLAPVSIHPFIEGQENRNSLLLTEMNPLPSPESHAVNRENWLHLTLQSQGLPKIFSLKHVRELPRGISEFLILLQGRPICESVIKVVSYRDGTYSVVGQIPDVGDIESIARSANASWPSAQEAFAVIQSALPAQSVPRTLDSCWWAVKESLVPALKLSVQSDDGPYIAWVSGDRVLGMRPDFFHIQGTITAYKTNSLDDETVVKSIELSEPGTSLTSEYLATVSGNRSISRAAGSDGVFDFPKDSTSFREANVFVHATEMLDWFFGKGFSWWGPTPLDLVVHWDMNGNTNNALYQPPSANTSGRASISVGSGDGRILQNLPFDSDAVSHEVGHHVVFATLSSTTGESLVIHEGLADFFVFLKSGDSCLGESICPEESNLCIDRGACLRRGDLPVTFENDDYQRYPPHQKGQLISATLLDLQRVAGIEADALADLVLGAVALLVPGDGFRALFLDLLAADKQQNQGINQCKILKVLLDRGFASQLAGVSCCGSGDVCIEQASGTANAPSRAKSKKDKPWYQEATGCGVIANGSRTDSNWLNLMLLLPLVFPLVLNARKIFRSATSR
jgi:hypothetical protein